MPRPAQWTNIFNPELSYYVYYCYANPFTLNKLHESKDMTTIRIHPHCVVSWRVTLTILLLHFLQLITLLMVGGRKDEYTDVDGIREK
ncbi:hypothetical protein L1987_22003 [Smallanthus sonchifolius]|uniref:Uncharacterized protein n=1 Tax=Smallanthus sonchifolius TaxID=185202 RepID=A0ACB9IF59_9ASTR|nr:hypothetical protein L1987_22003 [Smallanthus sonchifolius]